MEVICINSEFPIEWLNIYSKFGVVTPEKDKIYNIREVVKHKSTNLTGLLLEELENPKIPLQGLYSGHSLEPTWNINRFRTLFGEEIDVEAYERDYASFPDFIDTNENYR